MWQLDQTLSNWSVNGIYFDFFSVFFSFFSSQASSLSKEEHGKSESEDDFFEPWSSKRTGILAKYTTSEKLSITTVSYNAPYMCIHVFVNLCC